MGEVTEKYQFSKKNHYWMDAFSLADWCVYGGFPHD